MKKQDFKKGEIYHYTFGESLGMSAGHQGIFRCANPNTTYYSCSLAQYGSQIDTFYNYRSSFNDAKDNLYREATEEEKNWLIECEKSCGFVPKSKRGFVPKSKHGSVYEIY